MPDSSVLLFGGMALGGPASSSATRDQPPLCILNAVEFTAEFRRWLSRVYAQYTDAPRTPEQLATFDKWTLVPRFRADYESGKLVHSSGVSIEEMHLGLQLELSAPAISLVSNRYATQPLGRISRKQILPPEHIARLLEDRLPRTGRTLTVVLLVHDGHFGHSIVAFGADRERHCVRFLDPWPGGTLLAGDRNAAGVDAFPDPAFPGGWQIETSQLAKVLVAALFPLSFWNRWQDKPGSARDERPRRMETAAEGALFERLSRLSANPGSRSALGSAALALALVLAERGLRAEASDWMRQAAAAGMQEVMELLGDWNQRWVDQEEASYWKREAAVIKAGISPWKPDPAGSPEPSVSPQLYQTLPPWPTEFARGRELAEQGDIDGARSAYGCVIASGHPKAAPEAEYRLGMLLDQVGESEEAKNHLTKATLSCHLAVVSWAANHLGLILAKDGNDKAAVAAYERAIYSGHPMASAAAAINLANLYGQAGKTRPALEACARARASGIAPYAPQADWIAGYLLKSTGDVDGAIAAYRRAACFGEDWFAQQAHAELARLDPKQR